MTSSRPCFSGMKLNHHRSKHIENVMTTHRGHFIWSWITSKSFRNIPYRLAHHDGICASLYFKVRSLFFCKCPPYKLSRVNVCPITEMGCATYATFFQYITVFTYCFLNTFETTSGFTSRSNSRQEQRDEIFGYKNGCAGCHFFLPINGYIPPWRWWWVSVKFESKCIYFH